MKILQMLLQVCNFDEFSFEVFFLWIETRQLRTASISEEPLITLNSNPHTSSNSALYSGKLFSIE